MLSIKVISENPAISDGCKVLQHTKDRAQLWVKPTSDGTNPTFFYSFFNTIFKIEDATHVQYLNNIAESDGFTHQTVLAVADKVLYFLVFCSYHNRKDILSTHPAAFNILAHIDIKHLSDKIFPPRKDIYTLNLHFRFKNGEYYLNWNPSNHLAQGNKATLIKFNHNQASKYLIPSGAKIISNDTSHHSLPKYVVTDKEIFDVDSFRRFNLEKLFSMYGLNYNELFFRIFLTPSGKKLLFVYKDEVNFRELRNVKSTYLSRVPYVSGFLYDLDSQEIVLQDKVDDANNIWLKFLLYDDGLPHIFKIEAENGEHNFGVIFFDEKHNKFSKIIASKKPSIISCKNANDAQKTSDAIKTRFVFLTLKDKENHKFSVASSPEDIGSENLMMVLSEDLAIVNIDNHVILEAVNFCDKEATYVISPHSKTNVFHLSSHDSVILKSYKGEFGELILMFLSEGTKINYALSFFGYQRTVLGFEFGCGLNTIYQNSSYLLLNCRKNDFENDKYIINLQTHKFYTLDEFVTYLTENC